MKLTGMHLLVGLQPLSLSSSFAPKAVPCPHSSRLKNSLRNLVIDGPTKKPPVPKPVISQERKMTTKETANAAITEKEVRALFELWNSALATGDSRIVADRYIKKPMLLPTVVRTRCRYLDLSEPKTTHSHYLDRVRATSRAPVRS